MKAIVRYEYEITDPEDVKRMTDMHNVDKYKSVLWDLAEHLRAEIKHGSHPEKIEEVYEKIRTKLFELAEEHQVNIND